MPSPLSPYTYLRRKGGIAGGGTPAEFQQRINDDYKKFGRVIQAANIKPE